MKTWIKVSIIVASAGLLGGTYWLLVWRKREGVTIEDSQILSGYMVDDQPGIEGQSKENPFQSSFKDVFKNVFPEKVYNDTI